MWSCSACYISRVHAYFNYYQLLYIPLINILLNILLCEKRINQRVVQTNLQVMKVNKAGFQARRVKSKYLRILGFGGMTYFSRVTQNAKRKPSPVVMILLVTASHTLIIIIIKCR